MAANPFAYQTNNWRVYELLNTGRPVTNWQIIREARVLSFNTAILAIRNYLKRHPAESRDLVARRQGSTGTWEYQMVRLQADGQRALL